MGIKPLGVVKELIESAGMSIVYAHEDLVFIEHNAFLLQFTDKDSELAIHVNYEADEEAIHDDLSSLKAEASARNIKMLRGRYYRLHQDDEDNIRLEFMNAKE